MMREPTLRCGSSNCDAPGQIAELIENDEVHAGQVVGNPTLPAAAGLGLEPVDEIDYVVEAATRALTECSFGRSRSPSGFCQCRFRRSYERRQQPATGGSELLILLVIATELATDFGPNKAGLF